MSQLKHRILIIASRADIAGGEKYLLYCLKYLDRNRYQPLVWLPGDGAFRAALEQVDVQYVIEPVHYGWLKPPKPWYEFLSGLPERVRRLVSLISEHDIRLVHTNSNMILEGALAARLAGLHHVHVVHIPYQENLPIYQRMRLAPASFAQLMGDLSTCMIAVADPVARSISPPVPEEKIRVIHNGLELDTYTNIRAKADGSFRKEMRIPINAPLIAGIGRIHPDKGFDVFVQAASIVHQAIPNAHFLIAGAGDSPNYEKKLLAEIKAQGLIDHMHLPGFRNDIPQILAESDVFALTSRSEGGPYVLIEAMACGCACVASRCGGFVEHVIKHGKSGFLVDYGDANELATYLIKLLTDSGLKEKLVELAKTIVFSGEFDVRNSVSKLMAVYEEVFALPAPPPGSYPVDLLLQAASEIGYLGERLTTLEERMKKTERAAQLLLDNPLAKIARRIFGK